MTSTQATVNKCDATTLQEDFIGKLVLNIVCPYK